MKELNENPIDQYFKEILESPDLKFNKQDWKGFKKMLPNKQRQKRSAWWIYASAAAAILLLFTTLWLWNNPDETNEVAKMSKGRKDLQPEQKKDMRKDNISGKSGDNQSLKDIAGKRPEERLNRSSTAGIPDNPESFARVPDTVNIPVLKPGELLNTVQTQSPPVSDRPAVIVMPEIPADKLGGDQKKETLKDTERGKLTLALSFSPDLNSVSGFSNASFGGSFGIGAGYSISPRLKVSTAIAYSKKLYSAKPSEYKAPWAYSAGKYAESINADCSVLDVPLDLTYIFIKSKKQNIFASAGVSSYFMLKEKYTLDFPANSGYPSYPSYSYTNRNQHPLSVINLSVGIEKPVNKQTSLVIAPYARLPITGIGQGKVDLKSIGLNLQIQYNLKRKNSRNTISKNAAQ